MMEVMGDAARRERMSRNARLVAETYSEEAVMARWLRLFETLTRP